MSANLKKALIASMEAVDDDQNETLVELLEEASNIEPGISVAEVAEEIEDVGHVTGVLDNIANLAATQVEPESAEAEHGPGPVVEMGEEKVTLSNEALAFALSSVLAARGVKVVQSSLESADGDKSPVAISAMASKVSAQLNAGVKASMESYANDIRKEVASRISVVAKARGAIGKASGKVTAIVDRANGEQIDLTYKGIYDFLHREGLLQTQLADVLKPDIAVLKDLQKSIGEIHKKYIAATSITDTSEGGVQKFGQLISQINFYEEMGRFENVALLGNSRMELETINLDGIEFTVIDLGIEKTKNDGSKASAVKRSLAGGGGAVLGGLVGALVGVKTAVVAGAAGAASGVYLADRSERGSSTKDVNSPADVMTFLKDAQTMCDMVNEIGKMLGEAQAASAKAHNYLKAVLATAGSNDDTKVAVSNVLLSVLSVAVTGKNHNPGLKSQSQRVGETLDTMIDAVAMSYESMIQVYVDHIFGCVTGAMLVAEAVSKQNQ